MTKICPHCKAQNADTNKFCKNCGKDLNSNPRIATQNGKTMQSQSGDGVLGWWNKQDTKAKAGLGIGICCIGLIFIIMIGGMLSSDKTTTTQPTTPASTTTTPAENTTPPEPAPTPTTDEFSGLNNPSEVKNILTMFDHNNDKKIEFLDKYGSGDGMEEYAEWAVSAGMDRSDSYTLTLLFDKYDLNGDDYWDIYELDGFYDGYYANN